MASNQRKTIEQAKFTYLGEALEKQTERQINVLRSLKLSNRINELKRIEGEFPKNLVK